MTSSEERQHYMKTFARQLVSSTSQELSEDSDNDMLRAVEEALCESLQHLEDRFSTYLASYSHLTGASALRTFVNRSENNLNDRFISMTNSKMSSNVDHAHKQALRQCSAEIMKDLDLPGCSLLDDLMECDLLSVSDKDSIRGQSSLKRQNEEFYGYIEGRLTHDEFYNKFLPALRKDHTHLSDALITVLDQLEDENHESTCLPCRTRRIVQLKRLATPLLKKKLIDFPMYLDLRSHGISNNTKWFEIKEIVSDGDLINALEKKYPDLHSEFLQSDVKSLECSCPAQDVVDVCKIEQDDESEQDSISVFDKNATDFSDIDDIEQAQDFQFLNMDLDEEYKMTANPRGKCIVINNLNSVLRIRPGVHHDVIKIVETFKRLQFDVRVYNDLMAEDTVSKAYEYSQRDHSAYDAFVCIIMSKGSNGYIAGSDGLLFKEEEVTRLFYANNCPSLAGKPKIFFIQTNRGKTPMSSYENDGVEVADGADLLIGYSTTEGFTSFHSSSKGSVFINSLTKVLQQHSDKHDFLSCLTMTNRTVSGKKMPVRGQNVKQVPAPVFTLTKKLYLTSDPAWPH